MTMLGAFPASFLLPAAQPAILAAISCLFDASSIVFTIFYELHERSVVVFSRRHLFAGLAAVGVVVYGSLLYGWTLLERRNWTDVLANEAKQQKQTVDSEDENIRDSGDLHTKRIRQLGLHDWPLHRQLASLEFGLVVVFASVHMLRCNFYIESVNELLWTYGDVDGMYTRIFSFVLPAGIVFIPLIEVTVRRLGVVGGLHSTNALGFVFGTLLLVPSLSVQVVNFAVFACFRAFLYATLNSFIAFSFGVRTMGRCVGFTFTTASIVTLLQYPAAAVAENNHNRVGDAASQQPTADFTRINIVMLAACLLPVGLSLCYSRMLVRGVVGLKDDEKSPASSSDDGETKALLQA